MIDLTFDRLAISQQLCKDNLLIDGKASFELTLYK